MPRDMASFGVNQLQWCCSANMGDAGMTWPNTLCGGSTQAGKAHQISVLKQASSILSGNLRLAGQVDLLMHVGSSEYHSD
jgi:hypothetical protein